MSDWISQLQPASFRGVPFAVLVSQSRFGRRLAEHEYPFRDKPWIEDLGRGTRKIGITGFLISDSRIYGGGDVIAQRDRMVAACETQGPGTLVHPTLGQLTVSVKEVAIDERYDEGRLIGLEFAFIESGARVFPSVAADTGAANNAAADTLDDAAANDYDSATSDDFDYGAPAAEMAESTASDWSDVAQSCGQDATGLFNTVGALPGDFGRFFGGRRLGFSGSLLSDVTASTIGDLIGAGSTARALIASAGTALIAEASGRNPLSIADAAHALAASVLGAAVDPADGIRLLFRLARFYPAKPTTSSVIGAAVATIQTETGAMFRRAAIAAVARVTASYQPSSADDAATVRGGVSGLLDAEIVIAGDAGQDATYSALRSARAAVVLDLNARGAALPRMMQYTFDAPLPSLVLAQRLYRDPSRSDELITEATPRHPAFMPVAFSALAS